MNRIDQFFEALRGWAATGTGRPAFVMYADGRPSVPYVVIEPRWESEPDVGGGLTGQPAAASLTFAANSYGRSQQDALWLDGRLYDVLVHDAVPALAVEVLFREGDSTPVLTFTNEGLMLSKHRYRMTYR